jgi:membrane-bound lytic murein transglycosylase D
MRINWSILLNKVLVIICTITVFSACAPLKTGNIEREKPSSRTLSDTGYESQDWGLSDIYATLPEFEADQEGRLQGDVEPEPEQTIDQELLDLQRLGNWDQGIPAPRYSGDDVEYDFPVTVNRQVQYYLDFFTGKGRNSFALWLERSGRYIPMIHEHLVEAGLPKDLAYLAMIESGYNERAYSRAKAVGIWQFITSTGRNYGLEINNYVDERRDPIKSTRAAVTYLDALHDEFGSWYLAVAAYNAGEGKIRKAINKYDTTDFWKIAQGNYLQLETKRYVPKLIAAIIIAKEPEKYGFDNVKYEAPLDYETVEVPRWTSIKAVALACNMDPDDLKKYNNELRREFTPPDRSSYLFKVPAGKGRDVENNLPRVQAVVSTDFKTHTVRAGETLNTICKKYDLTKTVVLKSNNLRSAGLQPGQRLRIPYQTTIYEMLPEGTVSRGYMAAEASDGNFIIHKVRAGDTVYELAKIYNVPVHLIAAWNDIQDISRIRTGQQLVLYVRKAETTKVASVSSSSVDKMQLAPERVKETVTHDAEQQVKAELAALRAERDNSLSGEYYLVKEGDSLWTIARQYNMDAGELRSRNGLASNVIHPGDRILVGTASGKAAAESYYEVRNGDSLWTIARQYNIDARELRNRNGLASNVIHPGDRLLIGTASEKAAAEFYYEVRSGDSLWTIARQHDVSPEEIRLWNNLDDNMMIHPGNRLLLRVADAGEIMVDTYYQVRNGDSLWSIARQYNISPEEIKKWNNLKNSTIHPGNRLVLKIASGG